MVTLLIAGSIVLLILGFMVRSRQVAQMFVEPTSRAIGSLTDDSHSREERSEHAVQIVTGQDLSVRERIEALLWLSDQGTDEQLSRVITELLTGSDDALLITAIEVSGQRKITSVTEALAELLVPPPYPVDGLTFELDALGSGGAEHALRQGFLQEQPPELEGAVGRALREMGANGGLTALQGLLESGQIASPEPLRLARKAVQTLVEKKAADQSGALTVSDTRVDDGNLSLSLDRGALTIPIDDEESV